MHIKIYRGTHQIGGCIVGVSTRQTRILIDMGKQLPDTKGNMPAENLSIDDSYDAVVFTHYHNDHVGLLEYIAKNIPLYIGQAAKEILFLEKEQAENPLTDRISKMHIYQEGKTFTIGDIRITPILADHSAFDAYMLLIEADGKSVLHTGDYRLHGLKGAQMEQRLAALSETVDLMITEGTNLSYQNPVTTEERRLGEAAGVLMERFAYTFVLCSPTDFDRLAVFHKASLSKGAFFCDPYQMKLLETVREFDTTNSKEYQFENSKVYLEALAQQVQQEGGFCMAVRGEKSFAEAVKPYIERHNEKSLMIYSMSEGYLKKHKQNLEKMFGGFRYAVKLHTSGHASEEAIWTCVRHVAPKKVIPIHTEQSEKIKLGSMQNRVVFLADGEEYAIL